MRVEGVMNISIDDIGADALMRAATYALLARLFNKEIDAPLLLQLRQTEFSVTGLDDLQDSGAKLMDAYTSTANDDSKTELAVDFARIFVIREKGTHVAAYPNESVYTSEERIVMGKSRDSAMMFYRTHGYKIDDSCKLAEDHIAIELEFEKTLSLKIAESTKSGDNSRITECLNDQRVFLEQHLLNWTPSFLHIMKDVAHTNFYQGLALYTLGFLQSEKLYLDKVCNR